MLSEKKLLLKRLDFLDDMIEGQTIDTKNAGKYYFISSWSSLSEENLAFWSMYTNNMKGIRIELEPFPFLYYLKDEWITHSDYLKEESLEGTHMLPSIEPNIIKIGEKRHIHFFDPRDDFLKEVKYTDDPSLLKPRYFTETGAFRPNDIGKYKKKVWEFQKEWRYIFHYMPNQYFGFNEAIKSPNNFDELSKKLISHALTRGNYKDLIESEVPEFSFEKIKLDEKCFKKMKVLLGPKCSEGDKIIVESIIDHFNQSGNIELKWSSLKNTIR